MKKFIIIFLLMFCGCGFVPIKYKTLETPVVVKIENKRSEPINVRFKCGVYTVNTFRLEPHETKQVMVEYNVSQICNDPDGTELRNWEWCETIKSATGSFPIKENAEFVIDLTNYEKRRMSSNRSGGGDPVRMGLDIMRLFF